MWTKRGGGVKKCLFLSILRVWKLSTQGGGWWSKMAKLCPHRFVWKDVFWNVKAKLTYRAINFQMKIIDIHSLEMLINFNFLHFLSHDWNHLFLRFCPCFGFPNIGIFYHLFQNTKYVFIQVFNVLYKKNVNECSVEDRKNIRITYFDGIIHVLNLFIVICFIYFLVSLEWTK